MFRSTILASVTLATLVSAAGKAGVAWPWFNEGTSLDASIFGDGCGQVAHIYNWETWAPSKPGNLNFIGTQRCMDCESSPIKWLSARAKEQKWTDLFTLNEPDINNITPSQAANWYKQNINPIQDVNRGTPSITNSVAPGQGINWLKQFFDACGQECKHEFINIHWYGENFADFQKYIELVHENFPREYLAISEFALNINDHSADAQVKFYAQAIPYLEALAYVDMYFPYVASSPSALKKSGAASTSSCLFDDKNGLSLIGKLLIGQTI